MKVLFVAAEANPFCKTGGLADVAGSLPQALATHGVDARVILPRYRTIDISRHVVEDLATISVPFDGILQRATLQRITSTQNSSLPSQNYLLDAPQYFDREQLYGYADDV